MLNLVKSEGFRMGLFQVIATFSGSLITISDGMQYGWTAPVIPKLESPDSPISISKTDVVWLENIYLCGSLAGLPLTILSVDKLGRKKSIIIAVVQSLIAWIVIAFSPSVEYLYVARFLAGMAGDAAFVSAPMYISEIAGEKIRGFLSSTVYLFMLIGILVVYSVAPFVTMPVLSAVGCAFLVIELLSFPFMPESPYYLLLKDKKESARKSLQILRYSLDVETELEEIAAAVERQKTERGRPIDLFLSKSNRKAFLITVLLNFAQHFSGISVIYMNIYSILDNAASILKASTVSIIFSAIMFVSAIISATVIDKVGRKALLTGSSILTSVSLIILASYFTVKNNDVDVSAYNWVPVFSAMLYAVAYKFGLGMVPTVITAELYPTSVKAMGMTITDASYVVFAIISIYLYQCLKNIYGMQLPFFIFAAASITTAICTVLFIPETKGKTLEEIQMMLKGIPTTKNNDQANETNSKEEKADINTVL